MTSDAGRHDTGQDRQRKSSVEQKSVQDDGFPGRNTGRDRRQNKTFRGKHANRCQRGSRLSALLYVFRFALAKTLAPQGQRHVRDAARHGGKFLKQMGPLVWWILVFRPGIRAAGALFKLYRIDNFTVPGRPYQVSAPRAGAKPCPQCIAIQRFQSDRRAENGIDLHGLAQVCPGPAVAPNYDASRGDPKPLGQLTHQVQTVGVSQVESFQFRDDQDSLLVTSSGLPIVRWRVEQPFLIGR